MIMSHYSNFPDKINKICDSHKIRMINQINKLF